MLTICAEDLGGPSPSNQWSSDFSFHVQPGQSDKFIQILLYKRLVQVQLTFVYFCLLWIIQRSATMKRSAKYYPNHPKSLTAQHWEIVYTVATFRLHRICALPSTAWADCIAPAQVAAWGPNESCKEIQTARSSIASPFFSVGCKRDYLLGMSERIHTGLIETERNQDTKQHTNISKQK